MWGVESNMPSAMTDSDFQDWFLIWGFWAAYENAVWTHKWLLPKKLSDAEKAAFRPFNS